MCYAAVCAALCWHRFDWHIPLESESKLTSRHESSYRYVNTGFHWWKIIIYLLWLYVPKLQLLKMELKQFFTQTNKNFLYFSPSSNKCLVFECFKTVWKTVSNLSDTTSEYQKLSCIKDSKLIFNLFACCRCLLVNTSEFRLLTHITGVPHHAVCRSVIQYDLVVLGDWSTDWLGDYWVPTRRFTGTLTWWGKLLSPWKHYICHFILQEHLFH